MIINTLKFYIGNTDKQWFDFLREKSPDDVNFWQPGGKLKFQAIPSGAPFLFKLKNPINKIAGLGFYVSHSLLPIEFAWEVFLGKNGVESLENFNRKVGSYRTAGNSLLSNPNIGCIILTNPIFFAEADWVDLPIDWSPNIVQGKTYNNESRIGKQLWDMIENRIIKYNFLATQPETQSQFVLEPQEADRYGKEILTRVRLGQSAFRVLITDAYTRRCSISGERTLPVLEAAHIKPYEKSGPHLVSNGLLLRADIHKLFDKGYITITPKYKIEVSGRIREEFENGRDYYRHHGKDLINLPKRAQDKPMPEFVNWHNNNVFKG